jgi:predicted TIM-barrel fold metal-dependent hydrolase
MKYEMHDKFIEITSEKERELILGKNIARILNLNHFNEALLR